MPASTRWADCGPRSRDCSHVDGRERKQPLRGAVPQSLGWIRAKNPVKERKERRWVTAAEFLKELASDPEYVAAQKRLAREMEERAREDRIAEEPLLADLRRVGVGVASAWDLIERGREAYPPATADILLKHLPRTYPSRVRDGVARALAAVASHALWPRLKEAYLAEDDEWVKQGLAAALTAAGGPQEESQLVDLAIDPRKDRKSVV